jgi:hypothetical protein
MSREVDLAARMYAFMTERAQPVASHLRIAIKQDAIIICPLALAGEDTTIHVVACGGIEGRPEIYCIPDPRFRDDQYDLFAWLGVRLERYFQSCRRNGSYPQLWVSSGSAVSHLDTLADRLRFNRQNTAVRRFGELMTYSTERYPLHGQQTIHAATNALRMHFATGQQEGEDEHLGALLAWFDRSKEQDILTRIALAEREPMGVKTNPEFDRDELDPLVRAYDEARRNGESDARLERRADLIQSALQPLILGIYDNIQRAVRILRTNRMPRLSHLAWMEQREAEEFASFMNSRDAGYHLPIRDKPRSAAFKFADREDAAQNLESALIHGDRIARARGRLIGEILTGRVENPQRIHFGPRRFEHRFIVVTDQRVLHIRRRDDLCRLDDPRLHVVVAEDPRRCGGETRVTLRITSGSRSVGMPATGAQVEFGPAAPDWQRIIRQRIQLSKRLANAPWTHREEPPPGPRPQLGPRPRNLFTAIERLRQ